MTQEKQETWLLTFSNRETGRPVSHTPANIFYGKHSQAQVARVHFLRLLGGMHLYTTKSLTIWQYVQLSIILCAVLYFVPNLYRFGKFSAKNFTTSWAGDIEKVDFLNHKSVHFLLTKICNASDSSVCMSKTYYYKYKFCDVKKLAL